MKLCCEWGYDQVDFEGDTQVVFITVNALEENSAWYGALIEDAKALLQQNPLWKLSFIHKKGNQVAHEMEKIGLESILLERLWFYDFPCKPKSLQ